MFGNLFHEIHHCWGVDLPQIVDPFLIKKGLQFDVVSSLDTNLPDGFKTSSSSRVLHFGPRALFELLDMEEFVLDRNSLGQ